MVETDKAPACGDAIRLQLLIDAVVDYAIFQLDESGRIATWNTGAQRIKGYTESEIIGKHLSTFYTEEDQKSGVPQRALETAGQTGKYEAEGWRVRKDGTKFWALVVIDAIRDQETGKLIGFAKVTRDITERREAQLKLQAVQEQLHPKSRIPSRNALRRAFCSRSFSVSAPSSMLTRRTRSGCCARAERTRAVSLPPPRLKTGHRSGSN